jgi:hypothetical protein
MCMRLRKASKSYVPVNLQALAYTLDSSKMNRDNPNNLACEASKSEKIRRNIKNKLHGLSPRANYTYRATANCR